LNPEQCLAEERSGGAQGNKRHQWETDA
jgi:hypothetical protein